MEEMYHSDYDETLEALYSFIDSIPEQRLKMINIVKYRKMMQAAALLKNTLAQTENCFEINCEIFEKFNIGSVSVEVDALSVNSPEMFSDVIDTADCFEIYPLTSNKIRIELTFQSILKSLE